MERSGATRRCGGSITLDAPRYRCVANAIVRSFVRRAVFKCYGVAAPARDSLFRGEYFDARAETPRVVVALSERSSRIARTNLRPASVTLVSGANFTVRDNSER